MGQRTIPAAPLLAWFAQYARELPWRGHNIPAWHILVSEVMCQQTPVARVIEPYRAWIQRWPDPAALAADTVGQALRAWGRLGYPRRALRLHQCALICLAQYHGTIPADIPALLALPGIGEYTARAVAAFAFGQRTPVVDTNVRRVLSRAVRGNNDAGPATAADREQMAQLLPQRRAATFSAAVMELGALVCTAAKPDCANCPLRAGCAWRAAGYPSASKRRPSQAWQGTDRQLRGRIMHCLRQQPGQLSIAELRLALAIDQQRSAQFDRCLRGLGADGLVVGTDPVSLPG